MIEKYKITILYTAPTTIRTFMKWGEDIPAAHDLSSLRLLGSVGEPINPEAWIWYRKNIGGDRTPGRRHLVADRDRRDHDQPAARGHRRPSRARRCGRCPASAPTSSTTTATPVPNGGGGFLVLTEPWPAMTRGIWGDPDRFKDDLLGAVRRAGLLLRRRRREEGRRRRPLAARPRRRRHEHLRAPHLDHRGRVGAGVAPVGGRGRGRRRHRPDHRAGHRRVRDPARRRPDATRPRARSWSRPCATTWPRRSARSPSRGRS